MLNRLLNRLLALVGLICLFFIVFLVLPLVAFAQEVAVDPDVGGLSTGQIAMYGLIVLALIELAKRVVAVVPGKPGSAAIGAIESIVRNLLDFLAGKTGKPSDPSLIKRE